ncbi:MAG TPA: HEAT repeat domain-containing protein [Myxococcota bacterium]|nr:HEAT repeat domain-containing protein [Myxococcota bacterium]
MWNPSSTTRRCYLEDAGPFEVEGLRLSVLDGVWPWPDSVPRCEDVTVDVTARVADELLRLEHAEPSERGEAAKALAELGGGARTAVSALAARLGSEVEADPLHHAGAALIDLLGADAVPLFVDAIAKRTDLEGRKQLAQLIVGVGEGAASGLGPRLAEPKVAEVFRTKEIVEIDLAWGRRLLLERRAASGELDAPALESYLERRPDDEEMAQLALEALRDSADPKERYRLVDAVGRLRSPAAVAALLAALGDSDRTVVYNAASGLGILAQASPSLATAEVADAVAALIPTGDHTLLWQATTALGRIGLDTDLVRKALVAASASGDTRIRIVAAAARTQVAQARFGVGAMGRIPTDGGPSDEEVLREGLASNDWRIRGLAMARVKELGPLAAPLVDAVAARLGVSGDDGSRDDYLVELLLAIGPAAHPRLQGVANGRPRVRLETWLAVVDALGELSAAGAERAVTWECAYREDRYEGVDAAVIMLRLGRGRALDRARVIAELAQPWAYTLARSLTPHVRRLGLGGNERAAIAWLAEHNVDFHARRALARLSAELR